MPFLDRITVYPIKSLDGVAVSEVRILQGGSLAHDRAFAIVDERGDFVNGKRDKRVHLIRASFDAGIRTVTLRVQGSDRSQSFRLEDEVQALEDWLSDFFGFRVRMSQNAVNGFPDDTEAWGPTVVSRGTLEEVAAWFGGLSAEEAQARFRPNLILGGVPAFWEDRLFGTPGVSVGFEVGAVRFEGVNPCQRCVVPTRDPRTGEVIRGFQRRFSEKRKETLPEWAAVSRFDPFYRLSVNTRIPPSEAGKVVKVGDEVKIIHI
ncbi:MAG: MOSC domain-containing protein [Candidatus Latescibacteria bacterium]|nr:MOSC domain-containing protein [Candidatus Latescibacterota bacterium]